MNTAAIVIGASLIATTALASTSPAAFPSIIGVDLGKPLSVPDCVVPRRDAAGALDWGPYFAQQGVCRIHDDGAPDARSMARLELHGGAPHYLHGEVFITVEDGTVQEVSLQTIGVYGQQGTLADLERKFGKPTRLSRPIMQNGFGAASEAISAKWIRARYIVTYQSVVDSLDQGEIHLLTTAEAQRKAANAPRPSL